ncbi:hypothetical protein BU16DRAFT_530568 [Lophium mytilinum]|uniref:Cupin 2 conserved barrel domain-containing protein n=1 Tax=Lophium mytilinum TaxID=390894 RepID=A0A6A6QH76_9PEZI|nr:hypothetical protein BU16DRAFT_530568 [Lophium mytilinum]
MKVMVDDSKPDGHIDRCWTETTYDGKPGSMKLEVPGHWHKYHDEYMEVLRGRMTLYLEGTGSVVLAAGDERLKIPRWHVHSFAAFEGEEAVLKELTDPSGEFKAEFFRNATQSGSMNITDALRAFWEGDAYVSLPGNIKLLDQAFIAVAGTIAKFFWPAKRTYKAYPEM